jgi:hypothetical protein
VAELLNKGKKTSADQEKPTDQNQAQAHPSDPDSYSPGQSLAIDPDESRPSLDQGGEAKRHSEPSNETPGFEVALDEGQNPEEMAGDLSSQESFAYSLSSPEFLGALVRELQKDMNLSFALEKGKSPEIEGQYLTFYPASSFAAERIQSSQKKIREAVYRLTGQEAVIKIQPVEKVIPKDPDDPWTKQVDLVKDIFRGEVISQS